MDQTGGFLPSQSMADTFNALRGNDLIWSFFISNYLMGKEPRPFDLLFWNADQTRMPKSLHMFYLRNFYKDNALALGELTLGGVKLDLSKVKTPIYVQSSKDDHIAPYRSVYRGARAFGGPVTFTMAGSGHIAGVINHPDAKKYQHWTNDSLPGAVERLDLGRAGASGLVVAALVGLAAGQVGPAGPRPRSRQGQAEAARGRAGQLRAGALGHLIVDHDDRRTMFAQNSPGLRWSFPPCSRSAAARPWE
jgi:hypothetical protein